MSDNKMQQDSTELTCLNLVKEAYESNTCLFGLENIGVQGVQTR